MSFVIVHDGLSIIPKLVLVPQSGNFVPNFAVVFENRCQVFSAPNFAIPNIARPPPPQYRRKGIPLRHIYLVGNSVSLLRTVLRAAVQNESEFSRMKKISLLLCHCLRQASCCR